MAKKQTPKSSEPKAKRQRKVTVRTPGRPDADVIIGEGATEQDAQEAVAAIPATPSPEVTTAEVAPAASEVVVQDARAKVARLQAELNEARIALRDLTRRTPGQPRVKGEPSDAQRAHGKRSWMAPCDEMPQGGALWRKYIAPKLNK